MAERLVGHFGMETLEVIDQKPARLIEVEGIGPVRSERITKAWIEQRQIKARSRARTKLNLGLMFVR